MRVRGIAGLLALVVLALVAAPVGAITNGVPDGEAHPYVGLVVFYDAAGDPTHRCSGTLISPTVFVTAGHCTDGAASARVYFESNVDAVADYPFSGGFTGVPYTYPGYGAGFPNTGDLGVVVLDGAGYNPGSFATIAAVGTLDGLATQRGKQDISFTNVGYGLQEIKPVFSSERIRYQSTAKLVNLRSNLTDGFNLQTSNNPGQGRGGTCFGDSGGPVFLNNTNVLVAVTSFGLNQNCKGVDFAYRVDTAAAQAFIFGF